MHRQRSAGRHDPAAAKKSEGDIPLIAIATGLFDQFECVLRKMGVDDSEFTSASGGGRIHLYHHGGATIDGISEAAGLWESVDSMQKYSQVLLPCASDLSPDPTALANLVTYANLGGRALITDLEYVWLYNNGPFTNAVTWTADSEPDVRGPNSGMINTSFTQGQEFADWLTTVGATTTLSPPTIAITASYVRALGIPAGKGGQAWITSSDRHLHLRFRAARLSGVSARSTWTAAPGRATA